MKSIDWKILNVLSKKNSIRKAAEELYITQSALTKRIKVIEAEWNIQIVTRTHQGVKLTEDGLYLCRKADVMLDFLQEIEEHFREEAVEKPLLKIGVPNAIARLYLPEILSLYQEKYNRLQIQTIIASSDNLMGMLAGGTVDIAFICGEFPYAGEKVNLFSEHLYAVTPRGARIDSLERMPYIESYLNPAVKPLIDQWWLAYFGNPLHAAYSVPYHDIAIEMVEKGLGFSMLFGDRWEPDIDRTQQIPILNSKGKPVTRPVWLFAAPGCFRSEEITEFIAVVEKFYHVNGIKAE